MEEQPATYALRGPPEGPRKDPQLQHLLETTWKGKHDTGVGFRYRLNIERERIAEGSFRFLLQLNRQRLTERRQPHTFQLDAPFDGSRFHFNRVSDAEVLVELSAPIPTTLLMNNSPVTMFHSLVLPDRRRECPQLLTPAGVRAVLELLLSLPDRRYRVGYNSPGALASVNHLHLHLLRIDRDLYVQDTELVPVLGIPGLHRLPDEMPARGYCFALRDPARDLGPVCDGLQHLLGMLLQRRMAHNVFFTWTRLEPSVDGADIRALVFPRVSQCVNKVACSFNTAFLELSGFVSVGNVDDFERLTEESIVTALREAQGDVYGALRDSFPDAKGHTEG